MEQRCAPAAPGPIVAKIREVLSTAPGVVLGYLFGSRADGTADRSSDYDVAVLFAALADPLRDIEGIRHRLAVAFNGAPVDVVPLNRAPVELAYAVIAQGVDVFVRSEAERVDYEASVLARYGDCLHYLRFQFRELVERDEHDARVQRNRTALGRTLRTLGTLGDPGREA